MIGDEESEDADAAAEDEFGDFHAKLRAENDEVDEGEERRQECKDNGTKMSDLPTGGTGTETPCKGAKVDLIGNQCGSKYQIINNNVNAAYTFYVYFDNAVALGAASVAAATILTF